MLAEAGTLIQTKLTTWLEQLIIFSPNIIAALLVAIIFIAIAKISKGLFSKFSRKFTNKSSLRNFSTLFFQIVIVSIGIFIALGILDLGKTITSLLAGAGVAGLVMGFALQELISSYFSGITLSVSDSFRKGDLVEVNGKLGVVEHIGARTTIIETPTGQILEIPNKNVINNTIVNYTKKGKRRIDIRSGIDYEANKEKAKQVATETISKVKGVDTAMPIEYYFEDLGNYKLEFVIRFWMKFGNSQADFYALRSEVITRIFEAYEKEGISMPYPTSKIKIEK